MIIFREAKVDDIPQIQVVRNSVKENMLSDPSLVTDADCETYMTMRGKAWVCEINAVIAGFAYVDMLANNVWALFVDPQFAEKGIGKQLHYLMLKWYFSKTSLTIWLGTAPGTRAAVFYEMQGWERAGMHGKEIKFEMSFERWNEIKAQDNCKNL